MPRFDSLDAWLHWQEQFHPRPIDLGLSRVYGVYRELDCYKIKIPTVTIAGTNGKGSSVAYLEAIYLEAGYKVGAYTSPHILCYNERIRINGQQVNDAQICSAFAQIDQVRAEISLSYFEFGTLAALILFAMAGVDVQLLEVGLGGRLDAVNIVDPDVAILTSIGIDHVDWLGHTVEEIGKEKAGIFRKDVPAVIGDRQPPVSVLDTARSVQANIMQIGQQFDYDRSDSNWSWTYGDIILTDLPEPSLKGEHQYRNASAVLMAVNALQNYLPVSYQTVKKGLQNVQLKGRFQLIDGSVPVLVDVGHNPQAVQTLTDYLQESFPSVKIHAIFAMMKDKDISAVLDIMRNFVHTWYLAPLKNPRAATEELLKNYFQQLDIDNVHAGFVDFSEVFKAARNNAVPGELILIFGSFFLVSEYLSNS